MVLSLRELSIISIRDGIENGVISNLNKLPPTLRQSVLNYVLMHGTINEPECIKVLGSPEFFDGMTILDFQEGRVSDGKYLQSVVDTLAISTNEDEIIGDRITELCLNLYQPDEYYYLNIRAIIKLISRCRKLSILHLCIRENRENREFVNKHEQASAILIRDLEGFGLLNDHPIFKPCLSVLENIDELSIFQCTQYGARYLVNSRSIIKFKKLSSLTLTDDRCYLSPGRWNVLRLGGDMWRLFLENIQGTLKHLKIKTYIVDSTVFPGCLIRASYRANLRPNISELPCPLPELETLSIDNFECLERSVESFRRCPKLKEAYFEINAGDCCDYWPVLNEWNVDLKIKLNIDLYCGIYQMCNDFRLDAVSIFKDKIIKLDFISGCVEFPLYEAPRWQIALHHLLQECKNLEVVEFNIFPHKEIFQIFASDPNHASKVQTIRILGEPNVIDLSLQLKSILAKFLNLKVLAIQECHEYFDDLLIDWAMNGVSLTELEICDCKNNNVSDNGLIPIIMNSGGKLKNVVLCSNGWVSDRMWKMLFEHCRYVERTFGCPNNLIGAFLAKCFYGKRGVVIDYFIK